MPALMSLSKEDCLLILEALENRADCTPELALVKDKLRAAPKPIEELVFDFLEKNNLNILSIPTIEELGKVKGGYALVKAMSNAGGLKKIRASYSSFLRDHLFSKLGLGSWDEESLTG